MSHAHQLLEIVDRAHQEGHPDRLRVSSRGDHLAYLDSDGKRLDGDGKLEEALAKGWLELDADGIISVTEAGYEERDRFNDQMACASALRLLKSGVVYAEAPEGSALADLDPQERIVFLTECALDTEGVSLNRKRERQQWLTEEIKLWGEFLWSNGKQRAIERRQLFNKIEKAKRQD